MQRSAFCRSRRELSNAYLLTKFGFDTAENEPYFFVSSSSREFEFEVWNFEPLICNPARPSRRGRGKRPRPSKQKSSGAFRRRHSDPCIAAHKRGEIILFSFFHTFARYFFNSGNKNALWESQTLFAMTSPTLETYVHISEAKLPHIGGARFHVFPLEKFKTV